MMTGLRGEVIAWANNISDYFEGANRSLMSCNLVGRKEPEAVWYDVSSCLCVQFHPEYIFNHDANTLFSKMMEEYIL